MKFDIIGEITDIETIAQRSGVDARHYLSRLYGQGRWRKMKGIALIREPNGAVRQVELHWYEAHGIGRKDFKIKRYLD